MGVISSLKEKVDSVSRGMGRARSIGLGATAGVLVAAIATASVSGGTTMGPKLRVSDAWARAAAMQHAMGGTMAGHGEEPGPSMTINSGAYMNIINEGDTPDYLVGVRSSVAKSVEIHETVRDGDTVRMRPVPGQRVEVPARGQVELKPGGLHIMLIGLEQELRPGTTLTLVLSFERSGEMPVEVTVR